MTTAAPALKTVKNRKGGMNRPKWADWLVLVAVTPVPWTVPLAER